MMRGGGREGMGGAGGGQRVVLGEGWGTGGCDEIENTNVGWYTGKEMA